MKENFANTPWRRCGAKIYDKDDKLILDLNDELDSGFTDTFQIAQFIVESANSHDRLTDLVYRMFKQQVQNVSTTEHTKGEFLQLLIAAGLGDTIANCARHYLVKGCFFDMQLAEKFIDKYYIQLAEDVIISTGDDHWSTEDVEIAVRRIIAKMCGLED